MMNAEQRARIIAFNRRIRAVAEKAEEAQERAEKNGAFLLEVTEAIGESALLKALVSPVLMRIREARKK